ncbi:MAG: hypothetical protein WC696_04995 [Candidatus Methylopumilus sp.]|jgi:hypothetical protein
MNKKHEATYDPELPDASSVMASLCCVAVQYASNPSLELAKLASDLSHKLTAPQYAESKLVIEVAMRLVRQWGAILQEQNGLAVSIVPASLALH